MTKVEFDEITKWVSFEKFDLFEFSISGLAEQEIDMAI
jgi:hypothetical protein